MSVSGTMIMLPKNGFQPPIRRRRRVKYGLTPPLQHFRRRPRLNRSKLGVYQLKQCLATSQTQFGLTSNLLENFFSEFENFGEKFLAKYPVKSQKCAKKLNFCDDVISGPNTPPPPRHQSSSFGNPLPPSR